jgi:antirestriction protein ArdC
MPEATRVAGYKAWQSLGRQVRKGERGLRIFAPIVRRSQATDADTGEETQLQTLASFRLVSVFDISQTDGEPLAEQSMPEVAYADEETYCRLANIARQEGIQVVETDEPHSSARGWWDPGSRRITIVSRYSQASRTRTLLHELAHAFDPACDGFFGHARDERELVAESAAYLVGCSLGIELDAASAFYVSSWGGDTKRLQELAVQSLAVANRLEAAISAALKSEMVA